MKAKPLFSLLFLSLTLAHCTGKPHLQQPSFNQREIKSTVLNLNFPTTFKGGTESLQMTNTPEDQAFLFCCELEMDLPRSAVVHLRLNNAEAYSPLNHTQKKERLCAFLDRDKIKREKAILGHPLLLDLKATLLVARDEEIPTGKVSQCKLSSLYDNRFLSPEAPFFENFNFPKDKRKKRVLVFGSGTLIDQGNSSPPPFLAEKISDLYADSPIEVINLSTWSATFIDHFLNWDKIQNAKEKAPLAKPFFSQVYNLKQTPYLLKMTSLGAKNLKPDLIVISSMWNDFSPTSPIFNASAPLAFEYLITVLESSLSPKEEKTAKLADLSKKISALPIPSREFRFQQMKQVYEMSLEYFIKKIRQDIPNIPVLIVTLPLGLNESFLDKEILLKKIRETDFYEKNYQISFDPIHWSSVEKAQNEISQKIANKYKNTELLNLSQEYTEGFAQVSAARLLAFNYFTNDFMHFSSAGNSFVALRLEQKINEFLSKRAHP